jgi:CubicO group peptidase (beta-lactamase class C family)
MEPLEIPASAWSISYGKSFESDSMELFAIWSGARFTTRATARIGQLLLQKGRWGGVELVAPEWVQTATSYAGTPLPDRSQGSSHPAPGICWWSNSLGAWPALPRDAFAGAGAGGQVLLVVPSLDLVVVRYGNSLGDEPHGADFWQSLDESLLTPLARTLLDVPGEDEAGYRNEEPLAPAR